MVNRGLGCHTWLGWKTHLPNILFKWSLFSTSVHLSLHILEKTHMPFVYNYRFGLFSFLDSSSTSQNALEKIRGKMNLRSFFPLIFSSNAFWEGGARREESRKYITLRPVYSYYEWLRGSPCFQSVIWVTLCLGSMLGKRVSWSCYHMRDCHLFNVLS